MTSGDAELDYASWFASGEFTSDWSSMHFGVWTEILAPLRRAPVEILEIGSFEGRSATFFLEFLPHSRIVCVDRFAGSENPGYGRRFRHNMRRFGRRVETLRAESVTALMALLPSRSRFDLVYIDGGHARDDVLIDSLLCWRLLRVGGVMIWDDYELDISPWEGPRSAIDAALGLYEGCHDVLNRDRQVIIRKTAERKSFFHADPTLRAMAVRRFIGGRFDLARAAGHLWRVLQGRMS